MNNNTNSLKENYNKITSNFKRLGQSKSMFWNSKRRNK